MKHWWKWWWPTILLVLAWILGGAAVLHSEPLEIKPGTLCPDGLKYETVWVDGRFTAICYEGDVAEARAAVGADESRPSFTRKEGECMTCFADLPLEIYLELRAIRRDLEQR